VNPAPPVFEDDGYARYLREQLDHYKRLRVPFHRAWMFTLAKRRPPMDWGADIPPRGEREMSVIYFARPHFEAAYNHSPGTVPAEWAA